MDGLVTKGSFHRNSIHTGTSRKISLSKIGLQPKVSDFSHLPPFEGKPWSRSMKDIREWKKCMLKVMESVYWPGISDDIWEAVEKCGICQSTSRPTKPVGNLSEVPPHAWHTLEMDLFYWNRMDFLVVDDYFTKFLIMRKILNTSTHAVTMALEMIFTEFGCPFVLKSDNGLCYSSREFHDFLEFYQIHHITSSPHHLYTAVNLLRLYWAF